MSRKSLVDIRREEILQAFGRCVIKYGLDVSLEQIAAETGMQRSIIRHYIGNRDEVVEALIERMTHAYLEDIKTKFTAIAEAGSEAALLDFLFDIEENYADWDRAIVNILVTSKERYPSAKQNLQRMFGEAIDLLVQVLTVLYPDTTAEQCEQIGYALFCLVTTHETVQWIGFSSVQHSRARASAELLLETLRPRGTVAIRNRASAS
jgi:AcrR family transcriptional regulator